MNPIFLAQCQKLKRSPWAVLLLSGLTIIFTMVLGTNTSGQLTISTFAETSMSDLEQQAWLERLNTSDAYVFELQEEEKARRAVSEGRTELALMLFPEDYRIIVVADNPNTALIENHIRTVYLEELKLQAVERHLSAADLDVREALDQKLTQPTLQLETATIEGGGFNYNAQLQALFGFSLFFSILTITFSMSAVLEEKREGIWDRMILSSFSKTRMYLGHLSFSYIVGYAQVVLMFLIFHYLFGYDLGENLSTILIVTAVFSFAIVALGMLITGVVKTPQQFNTITPIVSVSMAMIGGAYWPIEIVTNPILITLSKVVPVTYGMEALKGAAYSGLGVLELLSPLAALVLFGVICMGIGINLMERRHV